MKSETFPSHLSLFNRKKHWTDIRVKSYEMEWKFAALFKNSSTSMRTYDDILFILFYSFPLNKTLANHRPTGCFLKEIVQTMNKHRKRWENIGFILSYYNYNNYDWWKNGCYFNQTLNLNNLCRKTFTQL